MLTQLSLSALRSDNVSYGLTNTLPMQSRLVLANGGSFNFNSLLENVVDVKTKNYTMFYLTQKNKISNYTIDIPLKPSTSKITTTIGFGTSALSYNGALSGASRTINNTYNLAFSALGSTNIFFTINFLDNETCTIGHNDGIGEYFAVLNSLSCISLKRSIFIATSSENLFRYVVSSDKLIISKALTVGSSIIDLQFTPVNGSLSGSIVNSGSTAASNLSSLSIIGNPTLFQAASLQDSNYIKYTGESDLLIKSDSTSITSVPCNYLVYKSIHSNSPNVHKIITLKNQFTESGIASRGDNLVLSAGNTDVTTNLRSYTSIFTDIDAEESGGLELNYVAYNKSVPLSIGKTYFKTENSLAPYDQININDTSLIRQGSFASISPKYADKVYYVKRTNDNNDKTLLCTWLFGDNYNTNDKKLWLDRYYYPDLIQKQTALSGVPLFNATFDSFAEKNIFNTASLLSSVKNEQYYDKISDFAFVPKSDYIYVREDLKALSQLLINNIDTVDVGYYNEINNNGGMFLSFDIINYTSEEYFTVMSTVNDIEGGITIKFNRDKIEFNCALFDSISANFNTISNTFTFPASKKISVLLSINTNTGNLKMLVDGRLVDNTSFEPYIYSRLLYGDIVANDLPLELVNKAFNLNEDVTNYINNVFLSVKPLAEEEVVAFAVGQSMRDAETRYISLPCGLRNNTDEILQLNSFEMNQKSKSSNINIHVSGLSGISDATRSELLQYITKNTADLLPLTSDIKNINII